MNKIIEANRVYTVPEAAAILGLHPETLKRMIRKERIKAQRIGHGYKILGANLITALNG
jgi:excisionase family DNA binding protein